MVRDIEHAIAIQQRRARQGKRGYSKAVRRFLNRRHRETYLNVKAKLPVRWNRNEARTADAA